jgi:hypothetical protein
MLLSIKPTIESLYQFKNKVDSDDKYIFSTPLKELLQQPISTIQKRAFKANLRLQDIRNRKKQQKNNTQIHPFFTTNLPKPTNKSNKQKPKKASKAYKINNIYKYFHHKAIPEAEEYSKNAKKMICYLPKM